MTGHGVRPYYNVTRKGGQGHMLLSLGQCCISITDEVMSDLSDNWTHNRVLSSVLSDTFILLSSSSVCMRARACVIVCACVRAFVRACVSNFPDLPKYYPLKPKTFLPIIVQLSLAANHDISQSEFFLPTKNPKLSATLKSTHTHPPGSQFSISSTKYNWKFPII